MSTTETRGGGWSQAPKPSQSKVISFFSEDAGYSVDVSREYWRFFTRIRPGFLHPHARQEGHYLVEISGATYYAVPGRNGDFFIHPRTEKLMGPYVGFFGDGIKYMMSDSSREIYPFPTKDQNLPNFYEKKVKRDPDLSVGNLRPRKAQVVTTIPFLWKEGKIIQIPMKKIPWWLRSQVKREAGSGRVILSMIEGKDPDHTRFLVNPNQDDGVVLMEPITGIPICGLDPLVRSTSAVPIVSQDYWTQQVLAHQYKVGGRVGEHNSSRTWARKDAELDCYQSYYWQLISQMHYHIKNLEILHGDVLEEFSNSKFNGDNMAYQVRNLLSDFAIGRMFQRRLVRPFFFEKMVELLTGKMCDLPYLKAAVAAWNMEIYVRNLVDDEKGGYNHSYKPFGYAACVISHRICRHLVDLQHYHTPDLVDREQAELIKQLFDRATHMNWKGLMMDLIINKVQHLGMSKVQLLDALDMDENPTTEQKRAFWLKYLVDPDEFMRFLDAYFLEKAHFPHGFLTHWFEGEGFYKPKANEAKLLDLIKSEDDIREAWEPDIPRSKLHELLGIGQKFDQYHILKAYGLTPAKVKAVLDSWYKRHRMVFPLYWDRLYYFNANFYQEAANMAVVLFAPAHERSKWNVQCSADMCEGAVRDFTNLSDPIVWGHETQTLDCFDRYCVEGGRFVRLRDKALAKGFSQQLWNDLGDFFIYLENKFPMIAKLGGEATAAKNVGDSHSDLMERTTSSVIWHTVNGLANRTWYQPYVNFNTITIRSRGYNHHDTHPRIMRFLGYRRWRSMRSTGRDGKPLRTFFDGCYVASQKWNPGLDEYRWVNDMYCEGFLPVYLDGLAELRATSHGYLSRYVNGNHGKAKHVGYREVREKAGQALHNLHATLVEGSKYLFLAEQAGYKLEVPKPEEGEPDQITSRIKARKSRRIMYWK